MEISATSMVVGGAVVVGGAWLGKKAWERHQEVSATIQTVGELSTDFGAHKDACKTKFAELDTSIANLGTLAQDAQARLGNLETIQKVEIDVSSPPVATASTVAAMAAAVRNRQSNKADSKAGK
jgi:hypothetical protein